MRALLSTHAPPNMSPRRPHTPALAVSLSCLQCGRDLVGRSHGVLHQRERAAEGDALLRQPGGVVRGHGDVREHLHLHGAHVSNDLHKVSPSSLRLTLGVVEPFPLHLTLPPLSVRRVPPPPAHEMSLLFAVDYCVPAIFIGT